MSTFLNNPWLVGVGGGVLSGLFVALITRTLFSRKDKREYVQKLNIANSEVLYAIRPGVSEGIIPETHIVQSLLDATSRKHAVDVDDLYSPSDIADELIKEVMDSSFLSAAAKIDFCGKLTGFKGNSKRKESDRIEAALNYDASEEYRSLTVSIISLMTGAMTSVLAFFVGFDGNNNIDEILPYMIIPATLTIVVVFIVRLLKDFKAQTMKIRFAGSEISFKSKKEETEPDVMGNG